jgi:hypothetical protein
MFSARVIVVAFACTLWFPAAAQSPYLERQKPIRLFADRQLFIEDSLVDSRSYVVRVMHQPVKEPEPVLVGSEPWEYWTVDIFGSHSVHFGPTAQVYRMWYTAYDTEHDQYYVCYATSTDGVHWRKPLLGIHELRGSKENNIVNMGRVFWLNSTVLIDEHESNPALRYKSLTWDFGPAQGPETIPTGHERPSPAAEYKKGRPLGISIAFSADGLHWDLYDGNPVLTGTGDTHFVLGWDENYHSYVGYFRPSYAASGGPRVIGFSTSEDFLHWTTPEIILRPDSLDAITDEFYGMPVFKYQGKYIGFLWIFHNSPNRALVRNPNRENIKGTQGMLENQLTYSDDGKHFVRVGDRQAFLPTGPEGAWDRGMVTASDLVEHGNEIWVYYGGWGTRHDGEDALRGKIVNGKRVMAGVGLAKLRLDGFVSLRAGDKEGIVTTRQILVDDRTYLLVNTDAGEGRLAVEILNDKFDPVPGFALPDAQVIHENSIAKEVTWRGQSDISKLRGQAVRIRFYLQNADLYSLSLK